jgi:hypothetical protein
VGARPPHSRSAPTSPAFAGSAATTVTVAGCSIRRTAATASATPLNHTLGWPSTSTRSGPPPARGAAGANTVLSIPGVTSRSGASGRSARTVAAR